ncbi:MULTISPECIES: MFS transporter [Paenibacillus]|uniref:MFS transporter n=1 Tax=Paenibacillus TaxID=44249 RepID=UPI001B17E976|nr:MFS transporter [Paenibacillus macerans]MEC0332481.1 MFS transporter [Paenibacillus macerans]GIP08925.1 minor myo-inositol transporter IolF [Paenibacillus macerans]
MNTLASREPSKQKKTIVAALANYIDAGSIVAGSAGLSLWVDYLGLNDSQIGLLGAMSANAISAAIGALIGGYLADKVGRKKIYTTSMVAYALGTLLIVFGVNFPMLLVGYIIAGIAVGADITASWTIIAENAPKEKRARHAGMAQVAWALGAVIVMLLSVLLGGMGLLGNRIVFAHLLVISLITLILRLRLPESEAWKSRQVHQKQGMIERKTYRHLFQRKFLRSILFLMGVYLVWNLAAGVMGFFMPYIYQKVGGVSATAANLLQMGYFTFTGLAVALIFMVFADKHRRKVYAFSALLAVAGWSLLLLPVDGIPILVLFIILMGINNGSGQQANYQLWSSELFPTSLRASAQGFMFFAVRITLGIWSVFVPMLLTDFGIRAVAAILVVFVFISFLIGTLFAPSTSGKSLEEIQLELYGEPKPPLFSNKGSSADLVEPKNEF